MHTNGMPPLALTMGEPAGIGGEITLMSWLVGRRAAVPTFFTIDDPRRLVDLAKRIGLDVPVVEIGAPEEAPDVFRRALPVLPIVVPAPVVPGRPDPANGVAVLRSIEQAVSLAASGDAAGVVTNPIQKSALYQAGFAHPGHTEFIAALVGSPMDPIMMLEGGGLRVVPVTVHLSLRDAIDRLDAAAICHAGRVTAAALRQDFGIAEPRLAVAALNPHAGEAGTLGREEIEIIAPAVERLRKEGLNVSAPLPADTLFHEEARRSYDAALCMYHDQALIPLKTLDFTAGVNITIGLSVVRTSPDHGTALDRAGTGTASPASLLSALATADRIARCRWTAANGNAAEDNDR